MISRYRLRRLLAPTAGFRKSALITLLGLICFALGVSLSFKLVIQPVLEGLKRSVDQLLGALVPADSLDTATHLFGGAMLFLGVYFCYLGVRGAIRVVTGRNELLDEYMRRQALAQGPRIVALGGGTGLSTLLRGLKQFSSNITAIVTVTDDGGSSGKLIRDKGMIPPGDIRNCLVALADAEKSMTDLFQHRFKADSGSLSGHSIGNLLIAGLLDQAGGDFEKAIDLASEVLNIRGTVVPSTLHPARLRAVLEDGREVCGETKIVESARRIRRIFLDPENVEANEAAVEAILDADVICIGPGSVYTSVVPNLLVAGIAEALSLTRAKRAYICNVMTQAGESDRFTASEHVNAIQSNIEGRLFDFVLVNSAAPSPQLLDRYREQGQHFVEADTDRIKAMGYKVIGGNFMSESDVVRHDPVRVATKVVSLVERG